MSYKPLASFTLELFADRVLDVAGAGDLEGRENLLFQPVIKPDGAKDPETRA